MVPELLLRLEGSRLPVSPLLFVNLFEPRWFSVYGLSGDHGNSSVWVLAGFREEMPDDTGRLQFNLDSGDISSGQILILG